MRTPLHDTSWCHTVGYLSPLLSFVAIAGHLGGDVPDVAGIVDAVLARRAEFTALAQTVSGCERLLAVASGLDEIAARELSLKVEEGVPPEYNQLRHDLLLALRPLVSLAPEAGGPRLDLGQVEFGDGEA